MDSLPSAVMTLFSLVVLYAPCIYLYKRCLLPEIRNTEVDFWIYLIGASLIISFSPFVDYIGDSLRMEDSVYSLGPSWVESVRKISADMSELRTDNEMDAVSRARLRQAFSRRVEISTLIAYAEKGVYASKSLYAIDDQVAKLALIEGTFRRSLERTLVALHEAFTSMDRCVIERGLLPENDAAPIGLASHLPELRIRFEETAATHRAIGNLSTVLSNICLLSMGEKHSLDNQVMAFQSLYAWTGITVAKGETMSRAISVMEDLSHEVCAGWKAAILVANQVHQFLVILELSMHRIVGDDGWTTDGSAEFHGMLAKGIMGVENLSEDLAFTREREDPFL